MRPSSNRPVFVVGESRSGTTLVYFCLLASSDFPVYRSESNLLACRSHYGRLARPANRREFLRDFLRSRQFERSGLDRDEFEETVTSRCGDYADVLREFMDAIAREHDKTRWVEKTPLHAWYLRRLHRSFPSAKFIHVVRDPRDVALSKQRLGWTPSFWGRESLQLMWGVRRWERTVDLVEAFRAGNPDSVLTVRYEDVILRSEETFERLSGFVGSDVSLDRIRSSGLDVLSETNTAYSGGDRGFSTRPVFRWKERLSPALCRGLSWAVRERLETYSYDGPSSREGAEDYPSRAAGFALKVIVGIQVELFRRGVLGRLSHNPLEFPESPGG